MRTYYKFYILVLACLLDCFLLVSAQEQRLPEIGKPLPSYTFTQLDFQGKNGKSKLSTNDLRGKWLIMHFFTLTCKGSFKPLATLDSIRNKYHRDIECLVVASENNAENKNIRRVKEWRWSTLGLKLPVVYDSGLFNAWNFETIPTMLVVDPDGILRQIIDGRDLTTERIGELLRGEPVSLHPKNGRRKLVPFEPTETEDNDLLCESQLTRWDGQIAHFGPDADAFLYWPDDVRQGGWKAAMMPLEYLYRYAFFGKAFWYPTDSTHYTKIYPRAIIEVKDQRPFHFDFTHDVGTGTYNYYLKMPDSCMTAENIMSRMQADLYNAFRYKAHIETREMPVWKIVEKGNAEKKLKTKGGPSTHHRYSALSGVEIQNGSIGNFILAACGNIPNEDRLPLINETNIHYNVDATIYTDMMSLAKVRKALNDYGLDIIKGTTSMQVLVIRD